METITLPKGCFVLPFEIRRRLGIEAGMRLEVDFDDKTGCIRIRPLKDNHINDLKRGKVEMDYRKHRSEKN